MDSSKNIHKILLDKFSEYGNTQLKKIDARTEVCL